MCDTRLDLKQGLKNVHTHTHSCMHYTYIEDITRIIATTK